ncbi:hypothetical protein DB347_04985 [Opitutaceae bacterium EW11]|nr:hypothetical protein DB347_04985 [Opitutaceae bacterium EW11]
MSTEIPESLKADLPASKWGKILGATPVVMTVVATLLAGLSSSEMTRAQYDRSLAAQLQSKAGDQWSFFQAKRLRSALQQTALETIGATDGLTVLDRSTLLDALAGSPAQKAAETEAGRKAVEALVARELGAPPPSLVGDRPVQEALNAVEAFKPESEVADLVSRIDDRTLDEALRTARQQTFALDDALKPVTRAVESMEQQIDRPETQASLRRAFGVSRLAYHAQRYDAEARLNQTIGSLYELQVRKSNLSAERHHRRSQKFFYGMLAAQMGVIISTLAIAAHKRSLLWSLAAGAGAIAIVFAVYVYLYV